MQRLGNLGQLFHASWRTFRIDEGPRIESTARRGWGYHDAPIPRTRTGPAMRITLVTETYFPQVNGVSRTLGQLVRVLHEAGDTVQLVSPHYGEPGRDEDHLLVRSLSMPFYRELHLPIPP